MHRLTAFALLILTCAAMLSLRRVDASATPTLSPENNPSIIKGTIDDKTNAVIGSIRITAKGGDVAIASVLREPLKLQGNEAVIIDRGNIEVPAGVTLKSNQAQDITVTIKNVTRPGVYKGSLTFQTLGMTGAIVTGAIVTSNPIALEVHIYQKPQITAKRNPLSIKLVRAQVPVLDTALARLLFADEATEGNWLEPLENQLPSKVSIASKDVYVIGERTGDTILPATLRMEESEKLSADSPPSILLKVENPNDLKPDSYSGTLRLKFADANDSTVDNSLAIPVTLSVREGPFLPLIVIILGIIIGRALRQLETPQAQKEANLIARFRTLQDRARQVKNAEAAAFLQLQMQDVGRHIASPNQPEQTVSQELEKLDASIDSFITLENAEELLEHPDLSSLAPDLLPKIVEARTALLGGNQEQASKLCREVLAKLRAAQPGEAVSAHAPRIERMAEVFSASNAKLTRTLLATPLTRSPRILSVFSGVDFVSAQIRFRYIRPVLLALLLAILAVLGFETLYVNGGATFGANRLYDYFSLFVWGISAEVTRSALQSFTKSK